MGNGFVLNTKPVRKTQIQKIVKHDRHNHGCHNKKLFKNTFQQKFLSYRNQSNDLHMLNGFNMIQIYTEGNFQTYYSYKKNIHR